MDHVIVFVNILILTIGFSVVYQGYQAYRVHRFPAVRAFVLYIGLYNAVMLLTLIAQYLLRNVESLSSDGMYVLVMVVMGFFGFSLAAVEIVMYASTMWRLSGDDGVPRWFAYSYVFVCTGWLAAFAAGSYRFFEFADKRFLLDVHVSINYTLTALFVLLPLLLVLRLRRVQPDRQRRLARTAGIFFLSLSLLDASGMAIPSPWNMLVMLLTSLSMNLLLLVNFGWFVREYFGPQTSDTGLNVDRICAEFRFSTREREIIEMILKGKSNKEIERELFISPHTVKNHIYHIFQKAGIKSRGQLVSMILQNSSDAAGKNES